jgi:hypothetical protein
VRVIGVGDASYKPDDTYSELIKNS